MINKLRYCPSCGMSQLSFTENKKFTCSACGFTLYHNVASAVAVLVQFQDKILFVKRAKDPGKGMLDLPGGFTDPRENAETTCARELQEELMLTIEPHSLTYLGSLPNTYLYKDILYYTLDLFYQIKLEEKPSFKLQEDEILEVVWLSLEELNLTDLAFESQQEALSFIKNEQENWRI